ncbi:hypothetical protein ACFX2I_027704 [Malus domestica]
MGRTDCREKKGGAEKYIKRRDRQQQGGRRKPVRSQREEEKAALGSEKNRSSLAALRGDSQENTMREGEYRMPWAA